MKKVAIGIMTGITMIPLLLGAMYICLASATSVGAWVTVVVSLLLAMGLNYED